MDSIFSNLLNALAEIWRSIGIAQKVSVILTLIGAAAACAAVVYFSTRPDWQILYADLDQKTASKVYDIVNEAGVQCKLANGGRTIYVPSTEVYKLRLKVGSEGVQTGVATSGGWETFDSLPMGATDLQQQMAKQRAIQGELEKMINQMPGVESSRVMLAMPQKSVYKKDKVNASASVVLSLKRGSMMDAQAINSVRCLIASSVPGMQPESVTITDNRGKLLARQKSEADGVYGGGSDSTLEAQTRIEQMLKEKAEAILRPIVGPDNVEARVTCDIDFDNIDQIIEKYDPEGVVVLTEKVITEDMSRGSSSSNGGAVGAGKNMPEPQQAEVDVNTGKEVAEAKTASEQKKISEKTYAVPKTVQKIAMKPGKIKKITVAVAVAKKADGTGWNIKDLERLVASAVGADIYRMNLEKEENVKASMPMITVVETDFYKAPQTPSKIDVIEELNYSYESIGKSPIVRSILGIAMLGALFLIFRKYFSRATEGGEGMSYGGVYSEDVKQLPGEDPQKLAATEMNTVMDALSSKAAASPQTVATLMENWMSHDQ